MENVSVLMFSSFFRWFLIGILFACIWIISVCKEWEVASLVSFVLGLVTLFIDVFIFVICLFDQNCTIQFSGQFNECLRMFLRMAFYIITLMFIINIIGLIIKYIKFNDSGNAVKITFRQFKDFINVDTENTWKYDIKFAYKSIIEEVKVEERYPYYYGTNNNSYCYITKQEKERIYVKFSFIDYIKYRIFLYVQKKEENKKKIVKENNEYNERAIRLLKSVQSDIEVFAKKEVTL